MHDYSAIKPTSVTVQAIGVGGVRPDGSCKCNVPSVTDYLSGFGENGDDNHRGFAATALSREVSKDPPARFRGSQVLSNDADTGNFVNDPIAAVVWADDQCPLLPNLHRITVIHGLQRALLMDTHPTVLDLEEAALR